MNLSTEILSPMLLSTILNITMVPKREKNVFWQCLNAFTFLLKRSFLIKHFSGIALLNVFFHLVLKIHSSRLAQLLETTTCYKECDIGHTFSSKGQYSVHLCYLLVGLESGLCFSPPSFLDRLLHLVWLTRPVNSGYISHSQVNVM